VFVLTLILKLFIIEKIKKTMIFYLRLKETYDIEVCSQKNSFSSLYYNFDIV
jgi:hypothetical protein